MKIPELRIELTTMTNARMARLFKRGLAWFERRADGTAADDWWMPLWTSAGAWYWDSTVQRYELANE